MEWEIKTICVFSALTFRLRYSHTKIEFEYLRSLYFRKLSPDKIQISAYAFCEERELLFAGLSNGSIICWDLCTSVPVARVVVAGAHEGPVRVLMFDNTTGLLVSGGLDHFINIWDPIFSDLVDVSGVEKLKIES